VSSEEDFFGASLFRSWLSVLTPPSDWWKVFPGFEKSPWAAATPVTDGAQFAQFAAMLREFATRYAAQRERDEPESPSMSAVVLALLKQLRNQVGLLHAATNDLGAPFIQALETQTRPILGPTREAHRRWAVVARAGLTHARAQQALQAAHFEVLERALVDIEGELGSAEGPAITSVRELYDCWVDCVDAAYREHALTDGYANQFAAVVDTGSSLRQVWRTWHTAATEQFAGAAQE
jgi:Poly(R)-hydroxyalkanoic acid synthase subunit (PHA_synth_III_E)